MVELIAGTKLFAVVVPQNDCADAVGAVGTIEPVVTGEPANQFEVAPVNEKLFKVPLAPVVAVAVVIAVLLLASKPWLNL